MRGGEGGGGAPGGHHGGDPGRGLNHHQLQGPGGGQQGVSFDGNEVYDYIDDARNLFGDDLYPLHCAFSGAEYEARQRSIFHPDGAPPMNSETRGSMPPPDNDWYRQHCMGLHLTMNLPGHLGQQGQTLLGTDNMARVTTRV